MVEVPNNSGTQMQRDKLAEAVKEFDSILKPNGQIIYLGTPQCEMSLYNELQNRGYECRIYPVVYPETRKERETYGDRLAPFIANAYDLEPTLAGKPTDPDRFNELEIEKRRLSYGKAGFALQFLLNTNLSDAEKYPLKVSDLIVADLDMTETSLKWSWASGGSQRLSNVPCVALKGDYYYAPFSRSEELSAYTGTIMSIDPSGRGKDETAFCVIKYLNGYLFLMEVGGYKDGYSDEVLTLLANKCKFWGVNTIVYESNFGDGMFGKLLAPVVNKIHPCELIESRSNSMKEARIIDNLEPVLMRHKLIVNTSVITDDYTKYQEDSGQQYSLIYQMTRLSRERGSLAHDDRIDCLSQGVEYWKEFMDRDADVGVQELLEEQLEMWLDPDFGLTYKPENPNIKRPKSLDNYNFVDSFLTR